MDTDEGQQAQRIVARPPFLASLTLGPSARGKKVTINKVVDYQTRAMLDTKGPKAPEGHTHRPAELRLG